MRNVLYSSEIVGTLHGGSGDADVRVIIDAKYEEPSSTLVATIETFLCSPGTEKRVTLSPAIILPKRQTIREHVDLTEALDVAKQIFSAATRKAHEIVSPAFR